MGSWAFNKSHCFCDFVYKDLVQTSNSEEGKNYLLVSATSFTKAWFKRDWREFIILKIEIILNFTILLISFLA